jgi:hypothetical protein
MTVYTNPFGNTLAASHHEQWYVGRGWYAVNLEKRPLPGSTNCQSTDTASITTANTAHRVEPGLLTFHTGQPQVQHHTLTVGAYPNPQLAEVPLGPRREVLPQPPHQARHRILRQRRATQKRRKRSTEPAGVGAAQVYPKDRLVARSVRR